MLTILKIVLNKENLENGRVNSNLGSIFQGFLMENISYDYAEILHNHSLKPYSQYVTMEKDTPCWIIKTLNTEAYEKIILPLLDEKIKNIILKHNNLEIEILEKKIVEQISYDDFVRKIYIDEQPNKYIKINFTTPTAFKSNGEYLIYPRLTNILYSLVQKYDENTSYTKLYDKEVFNEIIRNIKVVNYNLKSTKFHLEGTTVPSFKGYIVVLVKGNDTIKRLINLILKYSEYSGVGIKTAIGMGAIKI